VDAYGKRKYSQQASNRMLWTTCGKRKNTQQAIEVLDGLLEKEKHPARNKMMWMAYKKGKNTNNTNSNLRVRQTNILLN
jgi:hypothetical protein